MGAPWRFFFRGASGVSSCLASASVLNRDNSVLIPISECSFLFGAQSLISLRRPYFSFFLRAPSPECFFCLHRRQEGRQTKKLCLGRCVYAKSFQGASYRA